MSRIWVCTLQHPTKLNYRNLLGGEVCRMAEWTLHFPLLWIGIVLMPIRARIGIKTMPIHTRILPQVLHMLENRKNYFYSQQCQFTMFLLFLTNGKGVMILSIWTAY